MPHDDRGSRAARLLSWLAALLVVAGGIAVLVSGLQRTGAFGGEPALVGRLPKVTQPIVVTALGMTELSGATVKVRAASSSVSVPVFIGVGRANDVEAYLGDVARAELTAVEKTTVLRVVARPGAAALPDPSGVDVWAASVKAAGVATLTWPRTPGPWLLVIATDGRTPPTAAEFTWSGHAGPSAAPALIAVGAVLVAVGIAALLAMRSGRLLTAMGVGRAAGPARPGRAGGGASPRPTAEPGAAAGAAATATDGRRARGRRAASRPPDAEPERTTQADRTTRSEGEAFRSAADSPRRAGRHSAPAEPEDHALAEVDAPDRAETPGEVQTFDEPARTARADAVDGAVDGATDGATNDAGDDATDDAGDDAGDDDRPVVLPFRRGPAGTGGSDR